MPLRNPRDFKEICRFAKEEALRLEGQLRAWRRDFHMHPELGLQEHRTSALAAAHLQSLGMEVQTGVGGTGVVGLLRGGSSTGGSARAGGPAGVGGSAWARGGEHTVALRADMDALPIQEATGAPYASQVPGVMHACGHDGHVAMLLGAATILAGVREALPGNVKFIFQPAEESPGGARPMIEAGVLANPPVEAIFGAHLWAELPAGTVGIRYGTMMAAVDQFRILIKGEGGHGAAPHQAVDAICVAAQAVLSLQTIASRQIDPLEPVVLTIGTMNGGYRHNVIADRVELTGTVRTLSEKVRDEIPVRIERTLRGITEASGAGYELAYERGYPETINAPEPTRLVADVAAEMFGGGRVVETKAPEMGSEDFSFFLKEAPGTFFMVGIASPEKGIIHPHHHPAFDIDENALAIGAAVEVAVALSQLSLLEHSSGNL